MIFCILLKLQKRNVKKVTFDMRKCVNDYCGWIDALPDFFTKCPSCQTPTVLMEKSPND